MKLLEAVAIARDRRLAAEAEFEKAERAFQKALVRAREKGEHSWSEIGEAAGLSRYTARYHVLNLRESRKGERA